MRLLGGRYSWRGALALAIAAAQQLLRGAGAFLPSFTAGAASLTHSWDSRLFTPIHESDFLLLQSVTQPCTCD